MPKLTDPFSYSDNGVKSLLDSAMSVEGAYIGVPRTVSGLILRKGAKAGFDPANAFNSEVAAYQSHYQQYYDDDSVARHIATLLSGGREVYLNCTEEDVRLSHETPVFSETSKYSAVAASALAHLPQFLKNSFYQADLDNALRTAASKVLAGVAVLHSVVKEGQISRSNLASWLGRDPASSEKSPTYAAGTAFTSSRVAETPAPFDLWAPLLDPGYVLVACVGPTIGNGTENWDDPWTFTVLKFRLIVPTRLSLIVIKSQPLTSADWMQTALMLWFESWNFSGSPSVPVLGVAGTSTYYSTGTQRLTADATFGPALGVVTVQTGPSAVPSEAANFAALTAPQGRWSYPSTYTSTQGLVGTFNYSHSRIEMLQRVMNALHVPTTLEQWTDSNARAKLFLYRAAYNHAKIYVGCDLTSNRIVDVEYQLNDLPPPAPLSGELVRVDSLVSYATRVTSDKLVNVFESVETQSSEDLTAMKVEMEVNPRTFYGGLWDEPAVPPPAVLSRTEIQKTALDADEDMTNKVFLPRDPDDVNSTDTTYKQADNACSSFRADLRRRGIVVVGPSSAYVGTLLQPYAVIVAGIPKFVHPVDKTDLIDDQLTEVFAAIQSGADITFASWQDQAAKDYRSEPRPSYPDVWDMVCVEVFGKTYGTITKSSSAGAGSSQWTVSGQLSETGFLRRFSTWTPEFWLTVCGSKSWKIETLLGTLLTNPYGVGSLTQETLEAMDGLG